MGDSLNFFIGSLIASSCCRLMHSVTALYILHIVLERCTCVVLAQHMSICWRGTPLYSLAMGPAFCQSLHHLAWHGSAVHFIAWHCIALQCSSLHSKDMFLRCPLPRLAQHSTEGREGKSPLRQIQVGYQAAGGGQTWHQTDPQSSAPQHCCCAFWGAAPPPHPLPPPAETARHTILLATIYTCTPTIHGVYTVHASFLCSSLYPCS